MSGNKKYRKNYFRNSKARRRERLRSIVRAVAGLFVLTATSLLFVFGYDVLTQCDYFRTETVIVKGHHRLSPAMVLRQAEFKKGANLLSVNLKLSREKLLGHPWVADAQIRRELPGSLIIEIAEQEPLAVLDLGRRFLINRSGEIFKEVGENDPKHLPVVTGLEFSDIHVSDKKGSDAFKAVIAVLHLGLRPGSILPVRVLKKIHVDREIGLTLHAFDQTKIIKLGYDDYGDKYRQLEAVIVYLNRDGRLTDVASIDLNSLNRIVIRPERSGAPAGDHEEV